MRAAAACLCKLRWTGQCTRKSFSGSFRENAKLALTTLPPELVSMILLHEVLLADGVTQSCVDLYVSNGPHSLTRDSSSTKFFGFMFSSVTSCEHCVCQERVSVTVEVARSTRKPI